MANIGTYKRLLPRVEVQCHTLRCHIAHMTAHRYLDYKRLTLIGMPSRPFRHFSLWKWLPFRPYRNGQKVGATGSTPKFGEGCVFGAKRALTSCPLAGQIAPRMRARRCVPL